MSERITLVIEYEKPEDIPPVSASSEAFGGKVVAVQFSDALAEGDEIDQPQ